MGNISPNILSYNFASKTIQQEDPEEDENGWREIFLSENSIMIMKQ